MLFYLCTIRQVNLLKRAYTHHSERGYKKTCSVNIVCVQIMYVSIHKLKYIVYSNGGAIVKHCYVMFAAVY